MGKDGKVFHKLSTLPMMPRAGLNRYSILSLSFSIGRAASSKMWNTSTLFH
jgi:hypothetical protein